MDINFGGNQIVVTGAGKGIGRGICTLLAKCGAEVIAISRTKEDLDNLKAEVPAIYTIVSDVSDTSSIAKALDPFDKICGLVNNAAVSKLEPFLEVTEESFDSIIKTNVKAALFLSQVVAKKIISYGKGGAIVNVSSQASQAALIDHTSYCTSKAALDMMSKVMALELGPHKIRVNTVNPTVVLTDMGKVAWSDPARGGPMLAKIPLGKFAEVEDVAHAVVYLLSSKSDMINGATLPIDGGFLAC